MRRKTLAIAVIAAMAPSVHAADLGNGITFHGYGMVAGNFESNLNNPKNLSLHMDPTGAHQDPRGKLGDLGNTYWHDYFTSLTFNKKWENVGKDGQWADFSYEVVGYGDKGVETGQSYARMGGLSFLPENAILWAGRKNDSDRVSVFAYNIKEVNVDSGVGYIGDKFSITIGSNEVNWSSLNIDAAAGQSGTVEASNQVVDVEYRIGKAEFGLTFVNELENNFRPDGEMQSAISGYGKYTFDSFLGLTDGSTMFEAQYGKGVLAQYLNTDRITAISEEGDKSMRFTLDGVINSVEDVTIKPALIFEYTDREEDPTRITKTGFAVSGTDFVNTFGTADETGLFAGINVYQKLTDNVSMLYEANYADIKNKNGNDGMDGNMYKIAFGPALQLQTEPWAAPLASITLAYAGGDTELTFLDKEAEFRIGYRMEVWF